MASISVYGYDQRMLEEASQEDNCKDPKEEADPKTVEIAVRQNAGRCLLLELPVELRAIILQLVLPNTYDAGSKGTVWRCGNLAALFTSKQIYREAVAIMYSGNLFVLDVIFDCCTFAYQYRTSRLHADLISKRTMAFPDHFAPRNISLMRQFQVRVRHVDSYMGMIKYNYSGPGLIDGLQTQVKFLCQVLRDIPRIVCLHVNFQDDSKTTGTDVIVLAPFLELRNTYTASLSGNCTASFSQKLQSRLTNAYEKDSLPPKASI